MANGVRQVAGDLPGKFSNPQVDFTSAGLLGPQSSCPSEKGLFKVLVPNLEQASESHGRFIQTQLSGLPPPLELQILKVPGGLGNWDFSSPMTLGLLYRDGNWRTTGLECAVMLKVQSIGYCYQSAIETKYKN